MTHEELLLAEGAVYFGNRLIYKNKDIGVTAPGAALVLFAEGEEIVERLKDITDVVAKPAKTAKKKSEAYDTPLVEEISGE